MSTTKASGCSLAVFHLAEAGDKAREHAREHHYKAIYTLYLIANGFGEEFQDHQHGCFTMFPAILPSQAAIMQTRPQSMLFRSLPAAALCLSRSICHSEDDLFHGDGCQSYRDLLWTGSDFNIRCDRQISRLFRTHERPVRVTSISERNHLNVQAVTQ